MFTFCLSFDSQKKKSQDSIQMTAVLMQKNKKKTSFLTFASASKN